MFENGEGDGKIAEVVLFTSFQDITCEVVVHYASVSVLPPVDLGLICLEQEGRDFFLTYGSF